MKHNHATLHALFGGTFDPIHLGHLSTAKALAKEVGLQQVALMPNPVPPHRPQPIASAQQRLDMLRLAIADEPLFVIDDRELNSKTATYTVETLKQWRKEQGDQCPLAFIMGQDSLLSLPHWHQWQALLNYAHILVLARPGYLDTPYSSELSHWLAQHQIENVADLSAKAHGYVYLAKTPLFDISATQIRQALSGEKGEVLQNLPPLLPQSVINYIKKSHLYR